jgi:hypothetical protein
MVPRTFPSTYETANGQTRMVVFFLSSVSGLRKWVDYIPVKFTMLETQVNNSYNNNGVILVDPLSSTTNKQAWVDYVPVFVDENDTAAWRVDANGFIPVGFSTKPTLNLDFAGTKTLDPRVTFTRASNATYFDANGVMQTAGNDVARFDHNPTTLQSLGLLIEEQRTNLLTYSSEFDNAAWTKTRSSITANTIVAPDGTLTGDKLVEDTSATNSHLVIQTSTATKNATYTFSFFAKAAERSFCRVFLNGFSGNNIRVSFNLNTGATSASGFGGTGSFSNAAAVSVGNGWFRCFITGIPSTAAGTGFDAQINLATDGTINGDLYTGNGTSGIFIWGAQLEAGAFPTSYIPTVAATATRNADVASMTGTNFSSWYNATEGTLFVDALVSPNIANFPSSFTISDGTDANRLSLYLFTNGFYGNIRSGGAPQGDPSRLVSPVVGAPYKAAMGVVVNNAILAANGSVGTADTSLLMPVGVNQARIGTNQAGTAVSNTTIKRIAYYPVRLSNDQLQALTR